MSLLKNERSCLCSLSCTRWKGLFMIWGCLFSDPLPGAHPNGNYTLVSDLIDSDAISGSDAAQARPQHIRRCFSSQDVWGPQACFAQQLLARQMVDIKGIRAIREHGTIQLCGILSTFGMSNATCLSANKGTCNEDTFYKGHTGSEFI